MQISTSIALQHPEKSFVGTSLWRREVGSITEDMFASHVARVDGNQDVHTLVVEDMRVNRLVATATLFIERKLIHSCGAAGHIEDVVVDQVVRGTGVGRHLVQALTQCAKECGCYKVILDCNEKNVGFYEKCGYARKGVQMASYLS